MLRIDELELLNALFRTLIEGKFADDPRDPLVAGSPLVAEVCRRALDALTAADRARIERLDGPRRELAENNFARRQPLRLETQRHAQAVVRRRIAETGQWRDWTLEQRRGYVRDLAAPYAVGDELEAELLAAGDAAHGV